jgi:hypothetical protein
LNWFYWFYADQLWPERSDRTIGTDTLLREFVGRIYLKPLFGFDHMPHARQHVPGSTRHMLHAADNPAARKRDAGRVR